MILHVICGIILHVIGFVVMLWIIGLAIKQAGA